MIIFSGLIGPHNKPLNYKRYTVKYYEQFLAEVDDT